MEECSLNIHHPLSGFCDEEILHTIVQLSRSQLLVAGLAKKELSDEVRASCRAHDCYVESAVRATVKAKVKTTLIVSGLLRYGWNVRLQVVWTHWQIS